MKRTTLVLFLASLVAQFVCFPQAQPTREYILRDVRQTAKRHADSGTSKDSKYVLDLWEQNPAGVTRQEILRAYDLNPAHSGISRDRQTPY